MTAKDFTKLIYDLADELDLIVTHHQMGDVLDAISKHPVRSHYVRLHLTICRLISMYDTTRSIFIEAFCRFVEEKSPLFEDDYTVLHAPKPVLDKTDKDPYSRLPVPYPTAVGGVTWKMPKEPVPQSAVQGIVIDVNGNMLIMHRSDKVRSAKNCWSFPSGLHDIGETQEQCIIREVVEEYGLDVIDIRHVGIYENIAGDPEASEQYHWNVSVMVVLVNDVRAAINKEPEKHDQMKFINHIELAIPSLFFDQFPFHPTFADWLRGHAIDVMVASSYLLARYHRPYRTAVYECGCEVVCLSPPEMCATHPGEALIQEKELV